MKDKCINGKVNENGNVREGIPEKFPFCALLKLPLPPIRNLGNFFNFKKCQKDVFWDSFSRKMIAHAANTDVRTFAPFVLWSKLFCNKDQFSRLNQALFKNRPTGCVEEPSLPVPKLFYKDLVAPKRKPLCHMPNRASNNTLRH